MAISKKLTLWIIVFGVMANLGLSFHQYVLFIRAYASPEKAIILYIDKLHEANIEIVLMTIAFMFGLLSTYYILRNIKELVYNEGEPKK
jgi:hypothetical protein